MTKASIIITTHNRPRLLPRAVESARAAGSDVEVVVVDDASTDETAAVCQQIANINYVRVEDNQRVAGARNVGIVVSHGEYLSFLDDDDTRLAGSLDRQIDLLEQAPEAALIYGQAIVASEAQQDRSYPLECPQGDIFWKLLSANFIPCGTVVFRRSCFSRVGLLDERIPGLDDWDFWIRIAETYPVIATETPVMVWRQSKPTSGQGSSDTVDLIAQSRKRFREHWLELPRLANAPRSKQREAWLGFSNNVAEHLVWETSNAIRRGRLRHAAKSARTALGLHPTSLLRVLRSWTSTATVTTLLAARRNRDDMASAKAHFKRIRSSRN